MTKIKLLTENECYTVLHHDCKWGKPCLKDEHSRANSILLLGYVDMQATHYNVIAEIKNHD